MARSGCGITAMVSLVLLLLSVGHVTAFLATSRCGLCREGSVSIRDGKLQASATQLSGRPKRFRFTTTAACSSGSDAGEASAKVARKEHQEEDMQDCLPLHFTSASTVAWVQKMLDSFEDEFAGQPLLPGLDRDGCSQEEQARSIATAEFVVVSHDFLRNADDPIFIYGNQAGLRQFGYTWDEFTSLPSRKSCEEGLQQERKTFLDGVLEADESTPTSGYSGIRVTKTGERFLISGGVLWNVKDALGRVVGQAARISRASPVS